MLGDIVLDKPLYELGVTEQSESLRPAYKLFHVKSPNPSDNFFMQYIIYINQISINY